MLLTHEEKNFLMCLFSYDYYLQENPSLILILTQGSYSPNTTDKPEYEKKCK